MKPQETIYIAVADTSMIIRSGLVSVLRRLPDLPVQVIEVSSEEGPVSYTHLTLPTT